MLKLTLYNYSFCCWFFCFLGVLGTKPFVQELNLLRKGSGLNSLTEIPALDKVAVRISASAYDSVRTLAIAKKEASDVGYVGQILEVVVSSDSGKDLFHNTTATDIGLTGHHPAGWMIVLGASREHRSLQSTRNTKQSLVVLGATEIVNPGPLVIRQTPYNFDEGLFVVAELQEGLVILYGSIGKDPTDSEHDAVSSNEEGAVILQIGKKRKREWDLSKRQQDLTVNIGVQAVGGPSTFIWRDKLPGSGGGDDGGGGSSIVIIIVVVVVVLVILIAVLYLYKKRSSGSGSKIGGGYGAEMEMDGAGGLGFKDGFDEPQPFVDVVEAADDLEVDDYPGGWKKHDKIMGVSVTQGRPMMAVIIDYDPKEEMFNVRFLEDGSFEWLPAPNIRQPMDI